MDGKLNIEEMSIEELKSTIETLQAEIDDHKAELEEIKSKLGEGTMESEGAPVYDTPEAPQEDNDDPEVIELKRRRDELVALITEKQMQLVALQKRLNNLLADEAMDSYDKEEE